jgi:hypothetical protein
MKLSTLRSRIVVLALPVLFLSCAVPPEAPDTPEARSEAATTLARVLVAGGSWDNALSDGAEVAQGYTVQAIEVELERELTEEERARVQEILRSVIAEFVTADVWEETLSTVCAENFTASEMKSITAFLESPAGAKLLELGDDLALEINGRVDAMFEDRLDEFVDRVDEELDQAFEGLAEEEAQ